ncbi:MAG: HAD family phosphatase [Muribaculaceae bacterium]|nr:HAD family phosphatase [Muribaculaceae bacterium]
MENRADIAFLFDLDGVIVDSEKIYTGIWRHINEMFPTGVENFETVIKGTTLENILGTYYPDPDVRGQVEKALYEEENRLQYELMPGAERVLRTLRDKGIPTALVTSSNGVKMSHLWRQYPDLKELFQVIVTGDDVSASKPDPEGYISAAYRVGALPPRCAVFEDSVQGVCAGRNAGAYVVGIAGTVEADCLAPYADTVLAGTDKIDVEAIAEILKHRG